ncbi:MAG: DUF3052 domain-containing protein [Actinomycetota bacterium]
MAGYSGTPLPRKLGIAAGHRVAFAGAPKDFRHALGPLPDGVAVRTRVRGPLDVIVAFFVRRSELERRFPPLAAALEPDGGLWIAWPKRSSGVTTDLTEDVVREIAIANGMVDNKVCAIDDTWSGLRLVYRLRDRPPR